MAEERVEVELFVEERWYVLEVAAERVTVLVFVPVAFVALRLPTTLRLVVVAVPGLEVAVRVDTEALPPLMRAERRVTVERTPDDTRDVVPLCAKYDLRGVWALFKYLCPPPQ